MRYQTLANKFHVSGNNPNYLKVAPSHWHATIMHLKFTRTSQSFT